MATWKEIETVAPEFAARVQERFEAGTNKTLATLRADGSPRISASESKFEAGEVTLGMMGESRKLQDVRRDPRVALHSPTLEPPPQGPDAPPDTEPWRGDAKMSGRLVEVDAPPDNPYGDAGFFRLDITEVVASGRGLPASHEDVTADLTWC
jgi:hypothetical protein